MTHDIDDPKLTAYAIGELDEPDKAEVEARLASDPAARRFVEDTRATARLLADELAKEQLPAPRRRTIAPTRHWPARLALATAACVVVGGIAFSILAPRPPGSNDLALAPPTRPDPFTTAASTQPADPNVLYLPLPAQDATAETFTVPQSKAERDAVAARHHNLAQQQQQQRSRTVDDLVQNSRTLVREGRYNDALGIIDQIRVLDPSNDYAAGVRPLVEDKYKLQEQRRQRDDVQFTKQPNQAEEKKLPYDDILSYPANWPDIGDRAVPRGAAALAIPNQVIVDRGALVQPPAGFVVPVEPQPTPEREFNTEAYARIVDNPFLIVTQNPLSTFSIDVDTASYANVRRFLNEGRLPPPDAVRVEEMVNYFPYDYAPPPAEPEAPPFASHVEVAECPWAPEHRLVRVALKGKEIASHERPASNLVLLVDVSGSMQPENKLPLVKESMTRLVEKLGERDRVAMVVYAGSSGLVLDSTPATPRNKQEILAALERLSAGGSTNGGQGIELAYQTAASHLIPDGVNRVILCTDGDFNVGVTDSGSLTRLIEEKAKTGVFLSVLGFGMGNVKDATMEQLADKGNGNYAYIDTLMEANKVLVEQMSGTLVTIAKDVKIQVEFNPAAAAAYRLIGYENRVLAKEDFNDDRKDAGEIGAGHTVTALYEVVPAGRKVDAGGGVDPLKYQVPATQPADQPFADELLTLKLRYKQPDGDTSKLLEFPVKNEAKRFAETSANFKFATAVAGFGMILRDSPHKGAATLADVLEWAGQGVGNDEHGYRREFVELVKKSQVLKSR